MAFEELKQRQAAMWGSAPFEKVAVNLADMHELVVRELGGQPGERWLDVGCGTGELAIKAAATGAEVTGADIAVTLVETARRQAAEQGAQIAFEVADAEALPYEDASFEIVSSSLGAIFAPDHARVASELARVCRPGGRFALTAWAQGGSIDDFFRVMASYAPPPVEGAGNPLQWGGQAYCEERLGDDFELAFQHHNSPWAADSAEEIWSEMSEAFGPIKTLLGALDAERAATFREDLLEVFSGMARDDGIVMDRPYLLVLGRRR